MSKIPQDINDDEIRIISSEKKYTEKKDLPIVSISSKKKWNYWWIIGIVLFIGALAVFFWWEVKKDVEEPELFEIPTEKTLSQVPVTEDPFIGKGYVDIQDTVINKVPLVIFTPRNLKARLDIGTQVLQDTAPSFVVQAADIRRDNGEIVGAYVSKGNLLSKGQAKAGFCAIIDGKITLGVATSTPYLEQAIESDGYFFRQYPLVVGSQVVDNKLPSSSLRKALAELNGQIVVVMSQKKLTLNEFSETLVDLGVSNAIYLVGSTAYGFAKDKNGNKVEFGKEQEHPSRNTNYIVWE